MEFTSEFTEACWKQYMLDKEKRLIEFVNEDPFYVLSEVFSIDHWDFIIDELRDWLIIGLSSDLNVYSDFGERLTLIVFYDQLVLLIEALFICYERNIEDPVKKEKIPFYKINFLSNDEKINPKQVVVRFFENFTADYIPRELDDWFTASLTYPGYWRNNIVSSYHAQRVYANVLCLIKSAEILLLTKPGFWK